ncbi:hypothetical protein MRX96_017028 [Rhipicephalus microplus]
MYQPAKTTASQNLVVVIYVCSIPAAALSVVDHRCSVVASVLEAISTTEAATGVSVDTWSQLGSAVLLHVFSGTFGTALVVRPPGTIVDETPGSGTRRVAAAALRASDHCGRTIANVLDLVPAWANFGELLRGGCPEVQAAGPDLSWWLV